MPLARFSSLTKHLAQRIYGAMITAAADPAAAAAVVDRAEAALEVDDYCPFCAVMMDVPAARARADAGAIDDARRYLRSAERSAGLWEGHVLGGLPDGGSRPTWRRPRVTRHGPRAFAGAAADLFEAC